jgi:hypothetical protein
MGSGAHFWSSSRREMAIQLASSQKWLATEQLYNVAPGGDEAFIRLMLNNGADTEAENMWGETALHRAACYGHEAVVRLLVDNGVDVEAKDLDEETAPGGLLRARGSGAAADREGGRRHSEG